jgi:hypothetical protein
MLQIMTRGKAYEAQPAYRGPFVLVLVGKGGAAR